MNTVVWILIFTANIGGYGGGGAGVAEFSSLEKCEAAAAWLLKNHYRGQAKCFPK